MKTIIAHSLMFLLPGLSAALGAAPPALEVFPAGCGSYLLRGVLQPSAPGADILVMNEHSPNSFPVLVHALGSDVVKDYFGRAVELEAEVRSTRSDTKVLEVYAVKFRGPVTRSSALKVPYVLLEQRKCGQ